MKMKLTLGLLLICLVSFPALSIPTPAGAQGIQLGESVTVMAKVVAIDRTDRSVTLQGPDSNIVALEIPPEDPHFDRIAVGDDVKVTYHQSVAVYIGQPGMKPEAAAGTVMATSPKGSQPKAVVANVVDVSAKVLAIDRENRILTLEQADGRLVTTRVDESLEGFDSVKKGDLVHARYTEAIALSLEKQ
ncbi:MAG: hypothetical protein QNJ48_14440 [Desulfobacterales bacterium]|nr:hypothetical protein [Desulfobacterales bacterium]